MDKLNIEVVHSINYNGVAVLVDGKGEFDNLPPFLCNAVGNAQDSIGATLLHECYNQAEEEFDSTEQEVIVIIERIIKQIFGHAVNITITFDRVST